MSIPVAPARRVKSGATAPPRRTGTVAVHKFGGAALATAAGVANAAEIVARAASGGPARRAVVVASASGTATDALLAIARAAPVAAADQLRAEICRIGELHEQLLEAVADAAERSALGRMIARSVDELDRTTSAACAAGEITPREVDRLLAHGERLSAAILAGALRAGGVRASVVDAAAILPTDGRAGCATPDLARATGAVRRELVPLLRDGVVPVVPGFIGCGDDGQVVTFGRGGSDLTATVLAATLAARDVILWKDVPGLLTADPRVVPGARVLARMDGRETAELASYGARVLHPRALAPLGARTRVFIRPFALPGSAGTEISRGKPAGPHPARAIAATLDQVLVRISGRVPRQSPGLLARALTALDEARVDASLVSQAVTGHGVALVVAAGSAGCAVAALRRALAPDIALGDVTGIEARPGVATIGVVGAGPGEDPDASARVFGALAGAGIPVVATAIGAGGASMSLVLDSTRAADAQRAIHDAFDLDRTGGTRAAPPGHVDVVLLGPGAIGRELLAQLAAAPPAGSAPRLRVCAAVDRSGFVFEQHGLSRRRIHELCALKRAGRALASARGGIQAGTAEAVERITAHALSCPVVVDTTAADTTRSLEMALERGCDVVLANKIPIAAGQHEYDRLWAAAHRHGRHLRHEATVGAGLPVIDTLHKLLDAGDRVLRIEGCPSGTLGFIFGELGRGRAFSAALRDAIAAGYTEPDPRIDLSGIDVARKALILARLIGFRGDIADIAVESLVPGGLRGLPPGEFLARAEELDAACAARVRAARSRVRVLRYRARITRRAVSVGIVAVPLADPLGTLSGTDNQFAFTTARYRHRPLVITGPGAGVQVTAAGVYNDLLRLAAARAPAR